MRSEAVIGPSQLQAGQVVIVDIPGVGREKAKVLKVTQAGVLVRTAWPANSKDFKGGIWMVDQSQVKTEVFRKLREAEDKSSFPEITNMSDDSLRKAVQQSLEFMKKHGWGRTSLDMMRAELRRRGLKEADQPHSLSHGGTMAALPNKTHTELHDADLTPKEIAIIDKNEQDITRFASQVLLKKPLGVARRAMCAHLESLGIANRNSGKVADILIHMHHMDTSPETHIFQKVLPRIAQMPNIKGGGFYSGGSPGPWQPLG